MTQGKRIFVLSLSLSTPSMELLWGRRIGEDVNSADAVMATGFNWVPPLALIDAFGGVDIFREIALESFPEIFRNGRR